MFLLSTILTALAAAPADVPTSEPPPTEVAPAEDAPRMLTRDDLRAVPTGRCYRAVVLWAPGPPLDPTHAVDVGPRPIAHASRPRTVPQDTPPGDSTVRMIRPPDILPVPRSVPGALRLVPGASSGPRGVRVSGGAPTVILDGAQLTGW